LHLSFIPPPSLSVADPDPHHFGKLDPDLYQSGKLYPDTGTHQSEELDPDPAPHQSEKQDPDPHQSEKVEAFDGHFGAFEGSNLE
jgi:hypothetical protein